MVGATEDEGMGGTIGGYTVVDTAVGANTNMALGSGGTWRVGNVADNLVNDLTGGEAICIVMFDRVP